MPGRKCVVCGKSSAVSNKEGDKISYFSFPRAENLRKKWIEFCHNKVDNIITARICSEHFKEEDFHYKHGTEEVRKKRLKCNVIPSLYVEPRGGKQTKNNVSIKNSNKEISKDSLKKKDTSADTEIIKDQKSVLQTKRRSSSVNKNNKSIRVQFKKKSISDKKIPNMLSKNKNSKGTNNKENAKELTKRKNHLKQTSLGIKETSKKKIDQELIKKRKNSLNIGSVKKDQLKRKIVKKSVNKENQMGSAEDRINSLSNISLKDTSEEKLTSPVVTKCNKKELNRKTKDQPEIDLADEMRDIVEDNAPKEVTKDKINENNEEEISKEISDKKDSSESNSVNADVAKKTLKRKGFIGNGGRRKVLKKRIRLGKDDSDDSEEESSECRITNHVSRDKITYKSSSQMAHNEDLLKYLNYLKEKSRSADQPILFRVD